MARHTTGGAIAPQGFGQHFAQITADEDTAAKNLQDHKHKFEAAEKSVVQRKANTGKQVLEMPILDAFNSQLKIDQIWLPDLTLNNNFKEVARFDHCTTCHQAIEQTQAGSATLPGYDQAHEHSGAAGNAAKPCRSRKKMPTEIRCR